jgi:hypothetical protein
VNGFVEVLIVLIALFVLVQLANVKVWRAWWAHVRSHGGRYWWEVSRVRLAPAVCALGVGGLAFWRWMTRGLSRPSDLAPRSGSRVLCSRRALSSPGGCRTPRMTARGRDASDLRATET